MNNPFHEENPWMVDDEADEPKSPDWRQSFAADIEAYLGDEQVVAVSLGRPHDEVLSWDDARLELDYPYDSGYGVMDVHDVLIWTQNLVVSVDEYDGSISFTSVLRNPPALPE